MSSPVDPPAADTTGITIGIVRASVQAELDTIRTLYVDLGFRAIDAYCENPIPGTVWMELDLRNPPVACARSASHAP